MIPASPPLVSVVLPAYRSETFVAHAIHSVLDQTVSDLELLLIDDASGDGTAGVGEEIARADSRVHVLRNEHNLGTSRTVNRGVEEAKGTWVAQLDHDDTWKPPRLERLLEFAEEADIVSDDVEVVAPHADGHSGFRSGSLFEQLGARIEAPRRLGLVDFIRIDPGLVHPLMRRSFLLERGLALDPSFAIGADFGLWVRLLAHGARWIQLPEAYYVWSRAPNAQSRQLEAMVAEAERMTRVLAREPLVAANPEAVKALELRARLFRSHLAHSRVKQHLAARKPGKLVSMLVLEPRTVPLVLWRKSVYLRLEQRRRQRRRRRG